MAEALPPTTAGNDETNGQTIEYVDMSGKEGRLGPVYDSPPLGPISIRRPLFSPMRDRRPESESIELEEMEEGNKYMSLLASKLDPTFPPVPPAMRSTPEPEITSLAAGSPESDHGGEGGEYLSPVPALPLAPPRPSPSPFHAVQATVTKATVVIIFFQIILAANVIFLNYHFNEASDSSLPVNHNVTTLLHIYMDQFRDKLNALERKLLSNQHAIGQRTNRKWVTYTQMRNEQFADQKKNMTETFKKFDATLTEHTREMVLALWSLVNATLQAVREARARG